MRDEHKFLVVLALMVLFCVFFTGCATVTTTNCTPSSDLPAKKTMQKAPETEAGPERLFGLLVDERAGRAKDQRDYNSLYEQCVNRAPSVDPFRSR